MPFQRGMFDQGKLSNSPPQSKNFLKRDQVNQANPAVPSIATVNKAALTRRSTVNVFSEEIKAIPFRRTKIKRSFDYKQSNTEAKRRTSLLEVSVSPDFSLRVASFKEKVSGVTNTEAMASPWVLLFVFMVFIWVDSSQAQEQSSTVLRISYEQLNSSGFKPTDNKYLVSPNGVFCAGFYSLSASGYAFAVWYANDSERTMAWMANSTSLVGTNSSLILKNGSFSIVDENGQIAWNRNVSNSSAMDLTLQDSGNLVLNSSQSQPAWQSFSSPTDTLLPNQTLSKVGILVSRLANGSYSSGNDYYYLAFDDQSRISLYYKKEEQEGLTPKSYWNSEGTFTDLSLDDNGFLNTTSVLIMASDRGEANRLRRLVIESDGKLRIYSRNMNSPSPSWVLVWEAVLEYCKIHGSCGENAVCKVNQKWNTTCECPPGFDRNPVDNRSCRAITDIKDSSNVTFVPLDYVNFDGLNTSTKEPGAIRLQDCIDNCTKDSGCMGFTHNLDSGNCVYQLGQLINGYWSPEAHMRMYLKVTASGSEASNPFDGLFSIVENVCPSLIKLAFPPKDSDHTTRDLAIICSLFGVELLCGVLAFWAFLRKYSRFRDIARIFALDLMPSGGPKKRNMVVTNFPNSNMDSGDWYFPAWAFEMMVNEKVVGEVVDKRLVGVTENRSQLEAVERMVKTAFWCIQTRPEDRPSMGKVAKMLEGSVEIENPPKPELIYEVDGDSQPSYSGVQSFKSSAISRF
ncbi:hypothetical protein SUGI_0188080 [Cryptomeria japonica]|nr:hypothetical protein SUGI_0188080 [Cryptomeria japonica]